MTESLCNVLDSFLYSLVKFCNCNLAYIMQIKPFGIFTFVFASMSLFLYIYLCICMEQG